MHWSAKSYILLCLSSIMALAVVFKMFSNNRETLELANIRSVTGTDGADTNRVIAELIRQRNNISRQLNLKQQQVGQLQCEKQDAVREARSDSGGWCKKSSYENSGHHKTDTAIIPALAELFTGKEVASFGDGPGRYMQLLTDTGKLKLYDAYDGAPFGETTSEGRVKYLDLTLPQYGLPMYDWIISLEVAEHIPAQFESIYMDNIARHAKEGVVLSWAKPGQGGYSHVNNRAFEYVVKVFEDLGFTHDPTESQKLKSAASVSWLQWNTNVYRRTKQMETQNVLYV